MLTPKSSSCGAPVSMVFIAASGTALSMLPPDTDPAILPDLVTAIWLPAGRGELPQVSVTVATATCSPAARQVAAVPSTSSVSAMLMTPSFQARPLPPRESAAGLGGTGDRPACAGWPGCARGGTHPRAAALR